MTSAPRTSLRVVTRILRIRPEDVIITNLVKNKLQRDQQNDIITTILYAWCIQDGRTARHTLRRRIARDQVNYEARAPRPALKGE